MARITCPYCGHKQTFVGKQDTCQQCHEEVPSQYLKNARQRDPVWMVTIGYSQHGKTTYLDGLALTLENIAKMSMGTFSTTLDSHTFERLREIRREAQEGLLSDATQETGNRPRPLLLSVPNFLGHAYNTLVINDLPGEIFDKPEIAQNYAEPIQQARTIWFIISLADIFDDRQGRAIPDLLKSYIDSMERLGSQARDRHVLVVYTKADRLLNKLPEDIKNYLADDPYMAIQQMTMADTHANQLDAFAYLDQMARVSQALKEFTFNTVPQGATFVAMADHYGMKLSFSVVASVPGADKRTTGVDTPRHRMIDPLLWSLTSTESQEAQRKCSLIVDGGPQSSKLFQMNLPSEIFDALQDYNLEVNTYVTGKRKIETEQRPERAPIKEYLPMIGPIIDALPSEVYTVLVVDEAPFDLLDYEDSSWHDRILLVSTKPLTVPWPHKLHYDPAIVDAHDVATEFMSLLPRA